MHENRSAPRLELIAQRACIAGGALTGIITTAVGLGSPWGAPAILVAFMGGVAVLAALAGGALGGAFYWLVAGMFKRLNRALDNAEARALDPYRRQSLPRAQLVKF